MINRDNYEKLINEDIQRLEKEMNHSPERDHIKSVLIWSIDQIYKKSTEEVIREMTNIPPEKLKHVYGPGDDNYGRDKEIFPYTDRIVNEFYICEESVIKQAIEQYIDRPIDSNDIQKIEKISLGGCSNKHIISFNSVKLGMIHHENKDGEFTIRFQPGEINF